MSDSESDAPEAISFVKTRKEAKERQTKINKDIAAAQQRRRNINRERDQKLKARAAENNAEARMLRAMKEAEEEESDEEGDEDALEGSSEDSEEDGEEFTGIADDDEQDSEDAGDESMDDSTTKHLPDHLFMAAFSAPKSSQAKSSSTHPKEPPRRKKHKCKTKDLIVGSQIVRTLTRAKPAAAPPPRVNKFLNKRLALKGASKRPKEWERRPANVGVLKSSIGGPATNFRRII